MQGFEIYPRLVDRNRIGFRTDFSSLWLVVQDVTDKEKMVVEHSSTLANDPSYARHSALILVPQSVLSLRVHSLICRRVTKLLSLAKFLGKPVRENLFLKN